MSAVLRDYRPSTLERYLRIAWLLMMFLTSSDVNFGDVLLQHLLDFLAAARASHSQDREIHQISAQSAIKARWLARQAQWTTLSTALDSPVVRAYAVRGTAADRKEAMPIPWCIVAAWEQLICQQRTALCTKLSLGAILLATHASLRFGDIQRIDLSSLSLSCTALHGICYATKTTNQGQPFAVSLCGVSGRCTASCWTLHWLAALREAVQSTGTELKQVDFVWFNAQPELAALQEIAPASYCTAMLVLRWAATLPWHPPGQGLRPSEAKQLTLHSMKSTALASAAQLRLDKELRLMQGHHRVIETAQHCTPATMFLPVLMSSTASAKPSHRVSSGQTPVPEPPFSLPSGPPLLKLPADALLQGDWKVFATRHEFLAAEHCPATAAYASQTQPTQVDVEDLTSAGPIAPSDEEVEMVEKEACNVFECVPEQLCTALKGTGIQSIPDFAFAYNETLALKNPSTALPWPAFAERCTVVRRIQFLDGDAMPSVRLLSIVQKWFAPGGSIAWIPWQLRLSQKQYQEITESKTTKTLRTEAQFLSTALFDETPELPVDHVRLSPAWLGRIQTVFRNAIALCKGAHLARLKAFDLDLATHSPADNSLRTVTATELVAADRKLWQELAALHSAGWSLDDALHELTTVLSDSGNLYLQCRANLRLRLRRNSDKTEQAQAPAMLSAQKLAQALLSETQSTEGGSQAQKVLPTIDTEEGDYSSDDSELQAETIRFFLQVSSPEFEVSLRDLDPMHCLEAPQASRPELSTPLPSSGQWIPAPHSIDTASDLQGPHLEHCRGNWTAAEHSPELLAQLIQQEVDKGFVSRFEGTEEDAALQWPKGTAIGKLNVVMAEGRDPRLVLDSSVCGLNQAVHIPGHVALPTASDVQRTFLAEDCYAQQTALSIDFKGTLHSIAPYAWQAFYDSLNEQVFEVGSLKISSKVDERSISAKKAALSWNGFGNALRTSNL
ncbi:unnamed protein product, partial [Symbiodinium sp. KB8]